MRRLEETGRLSTEAQGSPLRRLGTPEDIAGVAIFPGGAMLDVNGGALMM